MFLEKKNWLLIAVSFAFFFSCGFVMDLVEHIPLPQSIWEAFPYVLCVAILGFSEALGAPFRGLGVLLRFPADLILTRDPSLVQIFVLCLYIATLLVGGFLFQKTISQVAIVVAKATPLAITFMVLCFVWICIPTPGAIVLTAVGIFSQLYSLLHLLFAEDIETFRVKLRMWVLSFLRSRTERQ